MLGFEPRSRQHDTSVCSPLHHIGKSSCCQPQESALSVFVSHRGNRHLYFTTRGLVGSSCERTSQGRGEAFCYTRSVTPISAQGPPRHPFRCLSRWLFFKLHLPLLSIKRAMSIHNSLEVLRGTIYALNLALSLPVAKHCVCLLHTRSIFILSTSQNRHSSLQEVNILLRTCRM